MNPSAEISLYFCLPTSADHDLFIGTSPGRISAMVLLATRQAWLVIQHDDATKDDCDFREDDLPIPFSTRRRGQQISDAIF